LSTVTARDAHTTGGELPLTHLLRLTDARGLFEHADLDQPRLEHGYCVDDVARGLEYAVRESRLLHSYGPADPVAAQVLLVLIETYLTFLEDALVPSGAFHNRLNIDDEWTDVAAGGDWWGRAMHALGITAAWAGDETTRARAAYTFRVGSAWTTSDLRAQLWAATGAADARIACVPGLRAAENMVLGRADDLLAAAVVACSTTDWPWPEPRLRYANGSLPEALLAVGSATGRRALVAHGMTMLAFLADIQTADGHLSLVGADGRGADDVGAQFDQQPIEAVTFASACSRAWDLTGDARWREGVRMAWNWFLGDNDSGVPMVDLMTGAGYDGLTPTGRNENRGAESTLAALTTQHLARRLGVTEVAPWSSV
jgi:hypothetical protein